MKQMTIPDAARNRAGQSSPHRATEGIGVRACGNRRVVSKQRWAWGGALFRPRLRQRLRHDRTQERRAQSFTT
jgi:hypothetical protein